MERKKYRINPRFIHLELTESAYTESIDKIINTFFSLIKNLLYMWFHLLFFNYHKASLPFSHPHLAAS